MFVHCSPPRRLQPDFVEVIKDLPVPRFRHAQAILGLGPRGGGRGVRTIGRLPKSGLNVSRGLSRPLMKGAGLPVRRSPEVSAPSRVRERETAFADSRSLPPRASHSREVAHEINTVAFGEGHRAAACSLLRTSAESWSDPDRRSPTTGSGSDRNKRSLEVSAPVRARATRRRLPALDPLFLVLLRTARSCLRDQHCARWRRHA